MSTFGKSSTLGKSTTFGKSSTNSTLKFGAKAAANTPKFDENTKMEDLEATAANIFIDTYDKVFSDNQNDKSSESADSYGKRIADMYDNSNHAIQETLVVLASEVDYGLSAIEGARADLEMYHSFIANSYNTPYMSTFIDNLEKRKVNISEAISEYENKLQEGKENETPDLLVQVLQEQNEAIVRCSARVSEIQRLIDELKEKKKITDDGDDSKKTIVSTVQTSFESFVDERRRDLEKRDTTDFKEHYEQEAAAAATAKPKFGLGKSGSTFGSKPLGSSLGSGSKTLGSSTGSGK